MDTRNEFSVPKTWANKLETNDASVVRKVSTVTPIIIGSKNIVAKVPNKFICSDKATKYGPTEIVIAIKTENVAFQKFDLYTFNILKTSTFSTLNFSPINCDIVGTTYTSPTIAR